MDGVGHGLRCQCSLVKGRRWVWVYVCMFEINAPTAITTKQCSGRVSRQHRPLSLNSSQSFPVSPVQPTKNRRAMALSDPA